MGFDSKYGQVSCEHGNIGATEPVFVFRGQDRLLPDVLRYYEQLCRQAGSPDEHIDAITGRINEIEQWQAVNFTQTPRSAAHE